MYKSLFEKACAGMYLEENNKDGYLIRTAEQFSSGNWVISEYPRSKTNLNGEYTNKEFQKLRNKYFKKIN